MLELFAQNTKEAVEGEFRLRVVSVARWWVKFVRGLGELNKRVRAHETA